MVGIYHYYQIQRDYKAHFRRTPDLVFHLTSPRTPNLVFRLHQANIRQIVKSDHQHKSILEGRFTLGEKTTRIGEKTTRIAH